MEKKLGVVHGVVHGPWSMFCIRPSTGGDWSNPSVVNQNTISGNQRFQELNNKETFFRCIYYSHAPPEKKDVFIA